MRTLDEALAEGHLAPLKAQVLALDEAVHATPGARIHLPLIRNLDVDAGHLGWARQRLADARARLAAGDRDGAWTAACEVAGYEDPGPDGWYDDLGHPGRAPHLRRGHGATLLQPMDPQNRPSHNTLARTYRGEPGCSSPATGSIRGRRTWSRSPTPAPPDGRRLVQRLEANGREVHPELEVPARTARQLTFPVPRDAYPFGHLDLEWFPATSRGNGGTAVSEVWVMRAPGGAPRAEPPGGARRRGPGPRRGKRRLGRPLHLLDGLRQGDGPCEGAEVRPRGTGVRGAGGVVLHVAVKLPDIVYGLQTKIAEGDVLTEVPWNENPESHSIAGPLPPPVTPGLSRRGLLTATGAGIGVVVVTSVGQTLTPL